MKYVHQQYGRGLGCLSFRREGIHLLIVCDFEAKGLLAMVKIQEMMHVSFNQQGYIVDLRISADIGVLVENVLP